MNIGLWSSDSKEECLRLSLYFGWKVVASPTAHVHFDVLAGHIRVDVLAERSSEKASSGMRNEVGNGSVIMVAVRGVEWRTSVTIELASTGCSLTGSSSLSLETFLDDLTRSGGVGCVA